MIRKYAFDVYICVCGISLMESSIPIATCKDKRDAFISFRNLLKICY